LIQINANATTSGANWTRADTSGYKEHAMGLFRKIDESAGLVHDMADRLDVDLMGIGGDGAEATALKYRQVVLSCTACHHHDDCRHLLDANAQLKDAPGYCRNRDVMMRR